MMGRRPSLAVVFRLDPLPVELKVVSPYTCSEGRLQLRVGGKNLCELDRDPPRPLRRFGRSGLHDHLFPYLRWFAANMGAFFRQDPFPLPLAARTAADFEKAGLAAVRRLRSLQRIEKASQAYGEWIRRHGFAAASDGGDPPNVFFRRVPGGVEVSWDNSRVRAYRGACRYRHVRGSAVVPVPAFRRVVRGFVLDCAQALRNRHPALRNDPEILWVLDQVKQLRSRP